MNTLRANESADDFANLAFSPNRSDSPGPDKPSTSDDFLRSTGGSAPRSSEGGPARVPQTSTGMPQTSTGMPQTSKGRVSTSEYARPVSAGLQAGTVRVYKEPATGENVQVTTGANATVGSSAGKPPAASRLAGAPASAQAASSASAQAPAAAQAPRNMTPQTVNVCSNNGNPVNGNSQPVSVRSSASSQPQRPVNVNRLVKPTVQPATVSREELWPTDMDVQLPPQPFLRTPAAPEVSVPKGNAGSLSIDEIWPVAASSPSARPGVNVASAPVTPPVIDAPAGAPAVEANPVEQESSPKTSLTYIDDLWPVETESQPVFGNEVVEGVDDASSASDTSASGSLEWLWPNDDEPQAVPAHEHPESTGATPAFLENGVATDTGKCVGDRHETDTAEVVSSGASVAPCDVSGNAIASQKNPIASQLNPARVAGVEPDSGAGTWFGRSADTAHRSNDRLGGGFDEEPSGETCCEHAFVDGADSIDHSQQSFAAPPSALAGFARIVVVLLLTATMSYAANFMTKSIASMKTRPVAAARIALSPAAVQLAAHSTEVPDPELKSTTEEEILGEVDQMKQTVAEPGISERELADRLQSSADCLQRSIVSAASNWSPEVRKQTQDVVVDYYNRAANLYKGLNDATSEVTVYEKLEMRLMASDAAMKRHLKLLSDPRLSAALVTDSAVPLGLNFIERGDYGNAEQAWIKGLDRAAGKEVRSGLRLSRLLADLYCADKRYAAEEPCRKLAVRLGLQTKDADQDHSVREDAEKWQRCLRALGKNDRANKLNQFLAAKDIQSIWGAIDGSTM